MNPGSQVARFTAEMLKEGTKKYSSVQISEEFDRRGAHLEIKAGFDTLVVTVYALRKNVTDLLPILAEMLLLPQFPDEELTILKDQAIQKQRIDQQKNAYVGFNSFQATSVWHKPPVWQKYKGGRYPGH